MQHIPHFFIPYFAFLKFKIMSQRNFSCRLLFFISVALFAACHKEAVLSDKRVVNFTEGDTRINYAYDNQKRLIRIDGFLDDTVKLQTTTYDYSQSNKVIETNHDTISGTYKIVYSLDGLGRTVKIYQIGSLTQPEDTTDVTNYIYDSDSHIIQINETSKDGSSSQGTSTYTNGNLTKSTNISTNKNGELSHSEQTYKYNYTVNNTLDAIHYGKNFLGNDSKNAVSKYTITGVMVNNGNAHPINYINNFTYEVDTEGYIVQTTRIATINGVEYARGSGINTHIYQ